MKHIDNFLILNHIFLIIQNKALKTTVELRVFGLQSPLGREVRNLSLWSVKRLSPQPTSVLSLALPTLVDLEPASPCHSNALSYGWFLCLALFLEASSALLGLDGLPPCHVLHSHSF